MHVSQTALALIVTCASRVAAAQDASMPGMAMPTNAARLSPTPTAAPSPPRQAEVVPSGAGVGAMPGSNGDDHGAMAMPGMAMHDAMAMKAALGPYSMNREASGTSWQPDSSPHRAIEIMRGGWMLMAHGQLNLVYDSQSGPRGGADKAFVAGMLMGMASRDLSERDHIQFRLMLSPDPLMGPEGYPLLLATGETADGRTPLVDRQHPHDLISEASVSFSRRFGDRASAFVYLGLPGEPAFGPPAFMHRLSIMDSPEAPISHHWLDSTHISEGVVTGGIVLGAVKLEASRFRGREPDQHRYDIEKPNLDSTAVRLSWNPTHTLALQASWAHQISPEQLDPLKNEDRWSASGIYTRALGNDGGFWSTTFAFGRRIDRKPGEVDRTLDAFVFESALHPDARWTLFARAERIDNDELLSLHGGGRAPAFTVGKVSAGAIQDFQLIAHVTFGLGALAARSIVPGGLDPVYGRDRWSEMGFVRLKIG